MLDEGEIKRKKQKVAAETSATDGTAYRIEDNGSMPFVAYVRSSGCMRGVSVFKRPESNNEDSSSDTDDEYVYDFDKERQKYTEEVETFINPVKTWIGVDDECGDHGNSILVQVEPDRYVFIGDEIYSFTFKEEVIAYYSIMGNNRVPYPVALTSKTALFMDDQQSVPRDQLQDKVTGVDKGWANAYQIYYDYNGKTTSFSDYKVICERNF